MCECHVFFLHLSGSKFPNVQLGLVKDIIIIIVIIIIGCSCIIITLLFRNSPIKIGDEYATTTRCPDSTNWAAIIFYKRLSPRSVTYANPIVFSLFKFISSLDAAG